MSHYINEEMKAERREEIVQIIFEWVYMKLELRSLDAQVRISHMI
jgi:hypothetical protein